MQGRVFVTRRVFDESIDLLQESFDVEGNATDRILSPAELRSASAPVDGLLALLTDTIDARLMDACPRLRIVSNFAVGYNNIDLGAATERGILVTNTPGVLTETTADFAWCLLLGAARRVAEADRMVRAGQFDAWGPRMLLGHDVFGKVLGIVGLGRIGQAVARRASGFHMKVVYHDSHPVASEVAAAVHAERVDLEELYRRSDFISLHVPLLEETRHLLGDAAFKAMKPTCIVVNTSRGPVVDEQALVRALQSGWIAGAGLDVYEREPAIDEALLTMDNVTLAPHIASASHETRLRMCMMAAENLVAGLRGQRPANLVNEDVWGRRRRLEP